MLPVSSSRAGPDVRVAAQYQQSSSSRNDDSDGEGYVPRTPRRTPMACTFCRGEPDPFAYPSHPISVVNPPGSV